MTEEDIIRIEKTENNVIIVNPVTKKISLFIVVVYQLTIKMTLINTNVLFQLIQAPKVVQFHQEIHYHQKYMHD